MPPAVPACWTKGALMAPGTVKAVAPEERSAMTVRVLNLMIVLVDAVLCLLLLLEDRVKVVQLSSKCFLMN